MSQKNKKLRLKKMSKSNLYYRNQILIKLSISCNLMSIICSSKENPNIFKMLLQILKSRLLINLIKESKSNIYKNYHFKNFYQKMVIIRITTITLIIPLITINLLF